MIAWEHSRAGIASTATWSRRDSDPERLLFLNHPDLVEEVLVTQNRKFIKHYRLRAAETDAGQRPLDQRGRILAQSAQARPAGVPSRANRRIRRCDGSIHRAHAGVLGRRTDPRRSGRHDAADARDRGQDALRRRDRQRLHRRQCGDGNPDAYVDDADGPVDSLPAWIPTPTNIMVERAARRLDEIILTIIAHRRRSGEDRGDLLSMLLHAQDEESGRRMTDQQLRDEAMTLFMAGHETTANTLAWVWFLLANHPESEAALHAELDAVLGDRAPTMADLPRLKYTGLVVTEALRVYPTVWMVGRENIEPVELGGYTIPAGTTVFMPQWTIHRDPRWFDEPESFRPERWAHGLQDQIHRYAYFPFGGGPRICIGNNFALMESALLLATIARRFRLRLAPDAVVKPLPSMTLRPDRGVKVVVTERR